MTDFVPIEVVRALDEERIAAAVLVPSMIQACLAVPNLEQRCFEALELLCTAHRRSRKRRCAGR